MSYYRPLLKSRMIIIRGAETKPIICNNFFYFSYTGSAVKPAVLPNQAICFFSGKNNDSFYAAGQYKI